MDLISKKTRIEFREYFVSTTLSIIRDAFDAADIRCSGTFIRDVDGQRRQLVEQYYQTIDWTNWVDVSKVLHVFENVLTELDHYAQTADSDWPAQQRLRLLDWLKRDAFILEDGRLNSRRQFSTLRGVTIAASRLTVPEILAQVDRIQIAIEKDPALAVGTAKELLETTCKFILKERSALPAGALDVPALVRATTKALKLMPDNIPEAAKGADGIRRVLSSLTQIASGIAELRNLYGTGHGRDGKLHGLLPRHARLVVTSAASVATFLLETHEAR